MSQQRCFLPGRSNTERLYCGVSEQGSLTTFNAGCMLGYSGGTFGLRDPVNVIPVLRKGAAVTSRNTLHSLDVRERPRMTNAKCRLFFLKDIVGPYSVIHGTVGAPSGNTALQISNAI